jgi:hypothetical protein
MLQIGSTNIATDAPRYRSRSRIEKRRFGGRSSEAKRVRQLAKSFAAQLGDKANDPLVRVRINSTAELVMIAEGWRAKAIRGEVEARDLIAISRFENAASQALRQLFGWADPDGRRRLRVLKPVSTEPEVSSVRDWMAAGVAQERDEKRPGGGHRPPPKLAPAPTPGAASRPPEQKEGRK